MQAHKSVPLTWAAHRVGVSDRVIHYWARHGLIAGAYLTREGEWRISHDDLVEWYESRGLEVVVNVRSIRSRIRSFFLGAGSVE